MLAQRVLQGDVRATARLMRHLDDRVEGAVEELKTLYPHAGKAYIIGITGSPGCGKSTLVDRLIEQYRSVGKKVGVIAVDPTSPFSGGAILGDRIRMQRHSTDTGVFIRSMATRCAMGGLSRSTNDVITVLDAFGMDVILVETVGVGQDEIDITRTAHTSIVVTVPGLGDEIQAIKAGIMEIGDIFVVNKTDKEGSDHAIRHIHQMMELREMDPLDWQPPILPVQAINNQGISELVDKIEEHRHFTAGRSDFEARMKERLKIRFLDLVKERLIERVTDELNASGQLAAIVENLFNRQKEPYSTADEVIGALMSNWSHR